MNPTLTSPPQPPRYYNGGYRYFFNGQEVDNEVLGEGALHAFEYRMHDTRIGRFWSVDPLAGKFPWNSVYAFAENRVVDGKELEGLEFISVNNSGVNPEAYENSDGTYNLSFGDIDFNNVSMTEFNGNNYFDIGQHLYYDKNGWNTIGTKENRITEWPNRPKFEDMWGNLPSKNIKAPDLIGGMVKFNFDNNPKSFSNTCAIRMSRALNYSNSMVTPLPTEKTKGRAGTGADKKWYYYGVTELNSYLNRTFGPPDLTINSTNLRKNDIRKIIQNETGIIFFRVSGWDDAVGHFDMWNGHSVKNSEYFNPSGNASLYEIDLWFLDGQ